MESKLVAVAGPLKGSSYPLTAESWVVGRSPECQLAIDDKALSRRHFQVITGPDGLRLEDLGSHNSTLLNGEQVTSPRLLRMGDEIKAGKSVFILTPLDEYPSFGNAAGHTAELRLTDSVYWSASSHVPEGERSTRDLKALVRLGSMIHEFVTELARAMPWHNDCWNC